jgi:lambda repressor-like predicted transcriptional regulator
MSISHKDKLKGIKNPMYGKHAINYIYVDATVEKDILEFYKKGYTQTKLSEEFNLSRDKITKILKKNNIKLRSMKEMCNLRRTNFKAGKDHYAYGKQANNYLECDLNAIINLYKSGCSLRVISSKLGLTKNKVRRELIKNNIKIRNSRDGKLLCRIPK